MYCKLSIARNPNSGFRTLLKMLSETDGAKHLVDILLGQSDIAACRFQFGVTEYLVEQDQSFGIAILRFVNVATEGLAEAMGGEGLDGNPVFDAPHFEQAVDVFQ